MKHLTADELKRAISNFKKVGAKKLVVSVPTEHLVSRFLAFLHGYSEEHKIEYKLKWKQVHRILEQELEPTKAEDFFTMQKISV